MIASAFLRTLVRRMKGPNEAIQGVIQVVDSLVAKTTDPADSEKRESLGKAKAGNLLDHLRQSGCSTEVLRHELINIFLAARDTTTSLFTSCIYELARREDIWSELRAEAQVLQNVALISLEQVRKLKFLRAVINESLRCELLLYFDSIFYRSFFVSLLIFESVSLKGFILQYGLIFAMHLKTTRCLPAPLCPQGMFPSHSSSAFTHVCYRDTPRHCLKKLHKLT